MGEEVEGRVGKTGNAQGLGDDTLEEAGEALVLDEVPHDPHARVLRLEVLVLDPGLREGEGALATAKTRGSGGKDAP